MHSGSRQPAKNGIHQRNFNGRRLHRLEECRISAGDNLPDGLLNQRIKNIVYECRFSAFMQFEQIK